MMGRYRKVFAAMLTSGVASVLSSIAMVARDLLMAKQFGVSGSVDGYLISYTFLMFVASVFANSIMPALMPAYIRLRTAVGEHASLALAWRAALAAACAVSLIAIVIAALSPQLIAILASNFSSSGRAISRETLLWMLGILPVQTFLAVLTVIANSRGAYLRPGLAPALPSIAAAVVLFLFARSFGIGVVAAATLCGAIVQLLLFPIEWRGLWSAKGQWKDDARVWGDLVRQYWPVVASGVLMSATPLVDQAMAATMAEGSVATLSYGQKLSGLVLSVSSIALSNAVLPHLSEMAARDAWAEIGHSLRVFRRVILAVVLPATAILYFFSEPIAILVFERGAVSRVDAINIAHVQALFLLQMPFYLLGMLSVRLISALKANVILMYGTALSIVLKVLFNYVLMQWFGLRGIALATTCVYVVACAYLTISAWRILRLRSEASRLGTALSG